MKPVFDSNKSILLIVDADGNTVYEIPRNPETGEAWKTEDEAIEYGNQFIQTLPPEPFNTVTEDDIKTLEQQLLQIVGLESADKLMLVVQTVEGSVLGLSDGSLTPEKIRQILYAFIQDESV